MNAELVAHTKPLIQLGEVVSRIERCRILTCADFRSRIRDREKLGIDERRDRDDPGRVLSGLVEIAEEGSISYDGAIQRGCILSLHQRQFVLDKRVRASNR